MKRYKVTLKTVNASQLIIYAVDGGAKKYNFKLNEPVIINDEYAIEQLRKQGHTGYTIEEISEV